MTIGEKIVNLRRKKKISQEVLAERLGISRQTLSNYENDITMPDIIILKYLSNIFNISTDELINNEVLAEKMLDTQKIVKKQVNLTKVLIISIYIIVMVALLFFTIHLLTKKDFTSKYQMEFTCYNKQNKSDIYKVLIETDLNETSLEKDSMFIQKYNGVFKNYVVVKHYDEFDNIYKDGDKYYAGETLNDIVSSLNAAKNILIDSGYVCH